MPERFLFSWKEISVYARYSARTIQRWEANSGFPVRRPSGKARSPVLALTSEIDGWFATAPMKQERRPEDVQPNGKVLHSPKRRSKGNDQTAQPAADVSARSEAARIKAHHLAAKTCSTVSELYLLIEKNRQLTESLKQAAAISVQTRLRSYSASLLQ
jgi:hypothetical protein